MFFKSELVNLPMCNHYRQAILRGERMPGWSIDQFSEIRIPIRFHNMAADVFPDREGLVIRAGDGEPVVEAMRWGFPPPPNAGRITWAQRLEWHVLIRATDVGELDAH